MVQTEEELAEVLLYISTPEYGLLHTANLQSNLYLAALPRRYRASLGHLLSLGVLIAKKNELSSPGELDEEFFQIRPKWSKFVSGNLEAMHELSLLYPRDPSLVVKEMTPSGRLLALYLCFSPIPGGHGVLKCQEEVDEALDFGIAESSGGLYFLRVDALSREIPGALAQHFDPLGAKSRRELAILANLFGQKTGLPSLEKSSREAGEPLYVALAQPFLSIAAKLRLEKIVSAALKTTPVSYPELQKAM